MNAIDEKLQERQNQGVPVRAALVGAGQMGQEIIAQVGEMTGMEVPVVVDLSLERALKGYTFSRRQKEIVEAKTVAEAEKAIRDGKWVVSTNAEVAAGAAGVDALIDATGSPEMGATLSLSAINARKHVVMMNVECDITIGPVLHQMAKNAGVVYTLASGDEPAAILELYRFARAIGFTVVAAGKGKNNPLDIYATPDSLEEKARARDMSARMLCEFVDGSKTMVEMAAVANATGLVPDRRGMHGPHCNTRDLLKTFVPKKDGGILGNLRRGGLRHRRREPQRLPRLHHRPRAPAGGTHPAGHGHGTLLPPPPPLSPVQLRSPSHGSARGVLRGILGSPAQNAKSRNASRWPRRTCRRARSWIPSGSTATAEASTSPRRPGGKSSSPWVW